MKAKIFILSLVIVILFLGQLSPNIYISSMPELTKLFKTSDALIEFSITIAMVTFAISMFLWGPLSDHYGRKIVIIIGSSIFIGGTLICLISTKISMLIIGRCIQGFGLGSTAVIGISIIRDTFISKKLVKAYSIAAAALIITPIIAIEIGAYLYERIDIRANSFFLLLLAVIVIIVTALFLPETNIRVREWPLSPKMIFKRYFKILFNIRFFGPMLLSVLVFSGEMTYLIIAPFLFDALKLPAIEYGFYLLLTISGFLIGSFLVTVLSKKTKINTLIFFGLFVVFLSSLMMAYFAKYADLTVFTLLFPMFIYMIGSGFIMPSTISKAMVGFDEHAGIASSLLNCSRVGGAGLIIIIIEKLVSTSFKSLSYSLLVISVLAIICFCFLVRQISEEKLK